MPPDPHDEFVELCALSTTGELTAEESTRLEEHLSQCSACRESQQAFERLVTLTIPALAEEEGVSAVNGTSNSSWSVEDAKAALMESLRNEPSPQSTGSAVRSRLSTVGMVGRYAAAAALLAAVGIGGYRLGGLRRGQSQSVAVLEPSATHNVLTRLGPVDGAGISQNVKVPGEPGQLAVLRHQLRQEESASARLEESRGQFQAELHARDADMARSEQERADMQQRLASLQSNAESLQAKLDQINNQRTQDTVQSPSLKTQIMELSSSIQEKDKEISEEHELLQHDRDIRDLISARNLYIAEIYDVGKTGDTQRPFGRVFYTRGRSLIFYGYDLDQQKGLKRASVFQAWGRRVTDGQHDVSLGLLYQDDANQKRWMLKLNDAKTIAEIDAVFVTVEPPGGSTKPSGKPLLFTYLRLDPNHP